MASQSGEKIDRVTDSVGQTRVLTGTTGDRSYFQLICFIEIILLLRIGLCKDDFGASLYTQHERAVHVTQFLKLSFATIG